MRMTTRLSFMDATSIWAFFSSVMMVSKPVASVYSAYLVFSVGTPRKALGHILPGQTTGASALH